MVNAVAVLPFIHRQWFDDCVSTMSDDFKGSTIFVDNTVVNAGIMASHNVGIDAMCTLDADWLIVMSAAVRFGEHGGNDFLDALDAYDEHLVVEAAGVYGWHLIAFSRQCIDTVGRWDENFTPYGFDDIDMSLRIQRAFGMDVVSEQWTKVVGDWSDAGMAHSIHLGGVRTETNDLIDYFIRKWGRHPGKSDIMAYSHPFNDERNSQMFWPQPNEQGGKWDD